MRELRKPSKGGPWPNHDKEDIVAVGIDEPKIIMSVNQKQKFLTANPARHLLLSIHPAQQTLETEIKFNFPQPPNFIVFSVWKPRPAPDQLPTTSAAS